MVKTIISIVMGCITLSSFSQENNAYCMSQALPFIKELEGFYIKDYCKYSESGSYEFVVDRNSRSIKKEGVYREVWYHRKGDSNLHLSGDQILQNYKNVILTAGGEVVKESDGSVFRIIYNKKEIWIHVNSNTYSADLDDYGITAVELVNNSQETNVPLTTETSAPVISGSTISKSVNPAVESVEGPTTLTAVIGDVDPVTPAGLNDFEKSFDVADFEDISDVSTREGLNIPENSHETVGTYINSPTATLIRIHTVTGNSAVAEADIRQANSNNRLVSKGFCWSTTPHPTTANMSSYIAFRSDTLTGLTPGTTYYVRPFGITSSGTTYGNEMSFHSGYVLGSTHAGGVVFYNDGQGHGMVCAETDQNAGAAAVWGCKGGLIGATGSGTERTNAVVSMCRTNNIAAKICFYLVLNNYSDWYLPSAEEFRLLGRNLIRKNLLGGIDTRYVYWTSSERDSHQAYGWALSEDIGYMAKDKGGSIRAIRNF